jgi:hypothetical protein
VTVQQQQIATTTTTTTTTTMATAVRITAVLKIYFNLL